MSATQSGFADCITAAFIDEAQSRREILVPRRAAEGCHSAVVSEGKARSGHVADLISQVSESTVSATQSGFTDCITAAFTAEDHVAVQSASGATRVSAFLEVVLKL